MVLYGHMHNYEGVWEQRVGDGLPTLFVNTGAISRGSLDEKTLSRIPTVLVFDVLKMPNGPVGAAYREIPLQSAKSAEAVFRLAEKQEKLDREADIEALLTSVKETGFAAFSSTSAIDKIKAMTTESDDAYVLGHFDAVKTVAIEILEQLGG
jgi:hypothetical protein